MHLAKAYFMIGNIKKSEEFLRKSDIETDSKIINCIIHNAHLKYYRYTAENEKAQKERLELAKALKNYTKNRLPKDDTSVEKIITYTYC